MTKVRTFEENIPIIDSFYYYFYSLMMETAEFDYVTTPCLQNWLRAKWCSKSSSLHGTKIPLVVSLLRVSLGYLM